MKIASHNTMTYLNPQWYFVPFKWMAKCQSKKYEDQLKVTDYLDFRIVFHKGKYIFAHGIMRYNKNVEEVLEDINNRFPGITIRIMNEEDRLKDMFVCFCKHIQEKYPNIKFVGGINKKDFKVLYDFGNPYPALIDKYSSCNHGKCEYDENGKEVKHKNYTGTYLDDLWPWIYAKLNNKKNIDKYKDTDKYVMLDFI